MTTKRTLMKVLAFTLPFSAFTFFSCSEDDPDLPIDSEAGTFHITSVTVAGLDPYTRVSYEGETEYDNSINKTYNGFTDGDKLSLSYSFEKGVTSEDSTCSKAYAIYNNGKWKITADAEGSAPITIRPDEGKTWADAYISADIYGELIHGGEENYFTVLQEIGAVQGNVPYYTYDQSIDAYGLAYLCGDLIGASSDAQEIEKYGCGSVTIDTDENSPTLGAVTMTMKRYDTALLRLPMSEVNVTPGTYAIKDTTYNVTGLATLWAMVKYESTTDYYYFHPFSKVTIDGTDYLQTLAYANGSPIIGFKVVMNVESEDTASTVTFNVPIKEDPEQAENLSVNLQKNILYPLTLNISPNGSFATIVPQQ